MIIISLETKELSDLSEDTYGKDEYIQKTREEIANLKDKIEVLDMKNREILSFNTKLEKINMDLEKQLKQAKDDIFELKDEMQSKEESYVRYELEVSEKLQEFKDMKKQIEQLNDKIEEKSHEIIILKAREYDSVCSDGQLDEMKLKFKKLEDERAKLEIQNDMINKDHSALKKQNLNLQQELDFLHASQSERIDELDMKFQLLKQDHQLLKEENHDLKEQERELKKEISLVEKSKDLFREELLELKKGKLINITIQQPKKKKIKCRSWNQSSK